ncbi:MAG: NAD-dependent epimerase/dehydratase family protein [Thaumarchaeota archaeon]|nr:NAD-dependent epimerase/dehydratase family protein [Nitrososphaerota archaeon]
MKGMTTILVTGANGFVGRRLVTKLLSDGKYKVRCLIRHPDVGAELGDVERVVGNANDYESLMRALTGIDVAFYLIHSMEGSSSNWERFEERDRTMARNFAKASTSCGVKRIIYLGGLASGDESALSRHMRSRREVGEILRTSAAAVTIFRAAVILGGGSASFEMMSQLVERLPFMVLPRWVTSKLQPIAIEDVVTYLAESVGNELTSGRDFDIGGPDILTYRQMMERYASRTHKRFRPLMLPFLTLNLSSYWVDLVTDVNASLARPLVESLSKDAVVADDSIKRVMPFRLASYEESIDAALRERKPRENSRKSRDITPLLLVLAALGLTTLVAGSLPELLGSLWTGLVLLWLVGIGYSLFFLRFGARMGALSAGVVAWLALAFWMLDAAVAVQMAVSESGSAIARDIVGIVLAAATVLLSHFSFHERRE